MYNSCSYRRRAKASNFRAAKTAHSAGARPLRAAFPGVEVPDHRQRISGAGQGRHPLRRVDQPSAGLCQSRRLHPHRVPPGGVEVDRNYSQPSTLHRRARTQAQGAELVSAGDADRDRQHRARPHHRKGAGHPAIRLRVLQADRDGVERLRLDAEAVIQRSKTGPSARINGVCHVTGNNLPRPGNFPAPWRILSSRMGSAK